MWDSPSQHKPPQEYMKHSVENERRVWAGTTCILHGILNVSSATKYYSPFCVHCHLHNRKRVTEINHLFQESFNSCRVYKHSVHSGFSITSKLSAELLNSKISNALQRPSSSRGPKRSKNNIAVENFNHTSGDMGSILSCSINHSLTVLYIYIFQLTIYKIHGEVFPVFA